MRYHTPFMALSHALERYYRAQMPIPDAVQIAVDAGDGTLLALANLRLVDVPHKGVWRPDEAMSHMTGFRLVHPTFTNGHNPNVFFAIGRAPNARYAVAAYSGEDAVNAAAAASKLKPLDIHDKAVPLNLIRRHMNHYKIEIPSDHRTVAWIL